MLRAASRARIWLRASTRDFTIEDSVGLDAVLADNWHHRFSGQRSQTDFCSINRSTGCQSETVPVHMFVPGIRDNRVWELS